MEHNLSHWFVFGLGFLAQGLFSARILVQWIISERQKRVVSPTIFWVLSLIASYIFFVYGFLRNDFAIMLGQVISYYIYIWNLKAKGVWSSSYRNEKKSSRLKRMALIALLALLVITPVIGISYILSDFEEFKRQFLQRSNIPLWLLVFGSAGQIIFTLRFIYQLAYSKRRNESLLPAGFWIISLVGSLIIVSYAFIRKDPVLALGQSIGFISYSRNLMLLRRERRAKTLQHK